MKEHVFHRLADFFFFRNRELLKIILQFYKSCQNIFQIDAVFFTKYTYSVAFPFIQWGIFSSVEWSEKNVEIFKIEKMAAVFLKILKMHFIEKAFFKIFYLILVDWRWYGLHILLVWLLVDNFFLFKKTFFEKKSKLLIFSVLPAQSTAIFRQWC